MQYYWQCGRWTDVLYVYRQPIFWKDIPYVSRYLWYGCPHAFSFFIRFLSIFLLQTKQSTFKYRLLLPSSNKKVAWLIKYLPILYITRTDLRKDGRIGRLLQMHYTVFWSHYGERIVFVIKYKLFSFIGYFVNFQSHSKKLNRLNYVSIRYSH